MGRASDTRSEGRNWQEMEELVADLRQSLHEHAETIAKLRADLVDAIQQKERREALLDKFTESNRLLNVQLADAIAQRDAAVKGYAEFREFIHRVRGAADGDMSFKYDDEEIVSLLGREARELLTKAEPPLSRVQKGEEGENR